MKISKEFLKRIIQEEIDSVAGVAEDDGLPVAGSKANKRKLTAILMPFAKLYLPGRIKTGVIKRDPGSGAKIIGKNSVKIWKVAGKALTHGCEERATRDRCLRVRGVWRQASSNCRTLFELGQVIIDDGVVNSKDLRIIKKILRYYVPPSKKLLSVTETLVYKNYKVPADDSDEL